MKSLLLLLVCALLCHVALAAVVPEAANVAASDLDKRSQRKSTNKAKQLVQAPSSSSSSASVLTSAEFNCIFPGLANGQQVYSALISSVKGKSLGTSRPEMAMFLGQVGHESNGLTATTEYCALSGSCLTSFDGPGWCGVKTPKGKHYYGRGYMQLSWACNYQAAGKAIGMDLLNNPDIVASSVSVSWQTSVWFWNVNNCGAGSYASATQKINGALECNGGPGASNQASRIAHYNTALKCMKLPNNRGPTRC
ncbi:lysozyme-like domain-containing protein [Polychytrium aggregatum]|uniref:lysozyme-like domain-containing protein n=1 Tax=Polychytrium aggregatum TaxID=110093 RepID=UPI0022FE8EEC|nr:lysozyme-like domain-containing protein [Polychytrium aggregatum]KAI9207206.1 lysozyme-like domain-containing protein [Polychytrium aggregatum]